MTTDATRIIALALLIAGPALGQHDHRHDQRALAEDTRSATAQISPLLAGLGEHHHQVTTTSERAQTFFDRVVEGATHLLGGDELGKDEPRS